MKIQAVSKLESTGKMYGFRCESTENVLEFHTYYLFTYLFNSLKVNYKMNMNKEGNKQTHTLKQRQTTKQENLCHSDNNKNSINAIAPAIMLPE
jgi:hypothetical protein